MLLTSPPRFWLVVPVPGAETGGDYYRSAVAIPSTWRFPVSLPEVAVPMKLAGRLAPHGVHRITFFGDITHHLRGRHLDWPMMGVRDWHRSVNALVRLAQPFPRIAVSRYEHGLLMDPASEMMRAQHHSRPRTATESLRKFLRRTLLQYWAVEGTQRAFDLREAASRNRESPRGGAAAQNRLRCTRTA